ncbi:MAG: pectinesterase family protein [Candidatus Coproplasma sp.]
MKKKKLLIFLLAAVSAVTVSTALVTTGCGGETETPPVVQDETPKVTLIFGVGMTDGAATVSKDGDNWVAAKPSNPVRPGYDFAGWYSDAACTDGNEVTFPLTVTGNTTVYAKWTVATIEVTGVALNKTEVSIEAGATDSLTATVSPENATDKAVTWSSSDEIVATVADGVVTAVNPGTATITVTTANNKTATCTVTVTEAVTVISTKADFLAFRTATELSGKYVLGADIDLAGEVLEASTAIIGEGVEFDGQGYTIINATYSDAAAKTGIVCAQIAGGTVTNIKFLNCSVTSSNESAAIVAGLCDGGNISKIEFNSCAVDTTVGNYAGLVFARAMTAENVTINVSEITVKNGCYAKCAQYGGLLVGDLTGSNITINFKDLDLDGELKGSSGNGAFIAGRTRGAKVSVENAVISATVSTENKNALFAGGSVGCASLTIKNVLVLKSNTTMVEYKPGTDTQSITNLCVVSGVTVSGSTGTGENTVAWLTANGFDFENTWVAEGDGYRLKSASTNVKSEGATLTSIKLNAANVTTRIKKGGTFSSAGLLIMGVYSDGVQLVLGENTGYTVDATAVDTTTAGKYTVTVKGKEDETKTATYEVEVVEQTGFNVYDEFMAHTYLAGQKLDTANLVVKSVWSDGAEETLASSEYAIAKDYDMNAAGVYTISVTNGEFAAKTFKISVVNTVPVAVDGKIYVNVDSNSTVANGVRVKGVETFTTIGDAIDYLEACKLDDSVTKVVYVAAGTYEQKITTDLCNLVLIGASKESTVLTYSAVESTVNIVTGSQYGLTCATLQVNGTGFQAYNITIRNDFNYIRDNKLESSPQGLALTINGDQAVVSNCYLYGNQDTLYLKSGRAYFKDTQIDGNIDFIFGEAKGLAFFENCTIKAITKFADDETNKSNNGYVTAMKATVADKPDYGYIFSGCTFTDDGKVADGSMSLGRPWGAKATVAYINCSFTKAYSTAAYDGSIKSRWFDMSGNKPEIADFCEYGSTGEGAITEAVNGGKVLTEAEAANYTKANIFAAKNGLCSWTAAWDCDAALTALTSLAGAKVAATSIYVSAEAIEVQAGETAELLVGVAPWNADDKEVTVTVADTAVATYANGVVSGVKAGTTTITVSKDGAESKTVTVTVTAAEGTKEYNYAFDYSALEAKEDKGTLAQADFTGVNSFLTVGSGVTYRVSAKCIENKDGGLSVTFQGTGTISIEFASTGGENNSRIGLKDSSGNYIEASDYGTATPVSDADAGTYEVVGTSYVTVTFTVTKAGTYTIDCPSSVTKRGARINAITMKDVVSESSASTATTYTYAYGEENASVWYTNAISKVTSADAAYSVHKLAFTDTDPFPGTYLQLQVSGTKATITLTGFTSGSNNASPFVQVDALDADGNVVASLVGTTGTGKNNAAITFTTNEINVAFASIRIASNTSGKSIGITTASIVVE